MRGIAGLYTDYLWFDSLNFEAIWRSILLTRLFLALSFIGIFFVLAWVNFTIVEKISPKTRPDGPEEEFFSKFHTSLLGKKLWIPKLVIAGLLALAVGASTQSQWQNWLLFINKSDFGIQDPLFNLDLGFYVFQLPFLLFLVNWLFVAFILTIIFTIFYHYINGGIRFKPKKGSRITPSVHIHISILLATLALIRAADYFLGRYELTTSTSGTVDGATYTDINARLPILNLLIVISFLSTALFIYNIWRRNWVMPAIAVGLWALVSITMGTIYPAVVQNFVVNPSESNREQVFIERNIEFTRRAMGLDNVEERVLNVQNATNYQDLVEDNRDIIDVIPIQDPKRLPQTFENLEGERGFYGFSNPIDVDRYTINGVATPVVVSARELDTQNLPQTGWESRHLAYTHGFGLSLSAANAVVNGLPEYQLGGLPPTNALNNVRLTEPRIYVGENLDGYAIVNTSRKEIDGDDIGSDTTASYTYTGDGGVRAGGFFRQAAFALRFFEINPLISNYVDGNARVIYIRNVRERVETIAPFLHLDDEIYPVISDGRIKYILDAYTTTNLYPYSQRANTEQLGQQSGLRHNFNYVRNSVKIVVDSFDGSVDFYVFDESDPIIATWRKAFPNLFKDRSEMPQDVLEHIRYPEDLFRIQTTVWGRYQLNSPQVFYENAEGWSVAQDPGSQTQAAISVVTTGAGEITGVEQIRIQPIYSVLRLPGEDERTYVILRPYVPVSSRDTRKELTAFIVAKSDPHNYGELVLYRTPGGNVDGPALINARTQSDPGISRIITLLDQQGSSVTFGDMILVPVEDSILYIRSLYVEAESTQVPELQQVVAVLGDSVVMCSTIEESLQALFDPGLVASPTETSLGQCVGTISSENTSIQTPVERPADPTPATESTGSTSTTQPVQPLQPDEPPVQTPDSSVTELLAEADSLFSQAQEALRNGDLGRYQELNDQAQALVSQALAAARN